MQWRLTVWQGSILLVAIVAPGVWGQNVQIPSTPYPYEPPPTFAQPGYGGFSGAPAQNYGSVPVGPAPMFDPYAPPSVSGSTLGPPPASLPYNYNQPQGFPQAPTYPQAPGAEAWQGYPAAPGGYPTAPGIPSGSQGLYPDGLPYDWQSGTYGYQASDGSFVKFQKFLQRIGFEYTWLSGSGSARSFEINRAELAATFGVPMFYNIETPLLITPGFAFNWLAGPLGDPNPPMMEPRGPDLPGQMYDTYLDFSWYPRPFQWFGAELGVRTGVWSDFNHVSSDSVRFLGRGLGVVSITPNLDLLVGVVYLDRMRVKILPAGGFHYRPNSVWDMYIVFPNPKLRRRFQSMGNTDWWWYVAGEYGGGSWTVNRSGMNDRIDYNDIRLVTGFEWELATKTRGHFEVGYVFEREILFESGMPGKFEPSGTFMLRTGVDF